MKTTRKITRMILNITFATLFLALYWIWLLYITQPATENNTYKFSKPITDIEINLAYHRGTDKLYIISQDHCYMIDTGWRNEEKSSTLAQSILADEQKYTITVWDHAPKSLFDIKGNNVSVRQVVDLRNDGNVYWNISNHNNYQRTERITGVILGVFFSAITAIFDFFVILRES